VDPEKEARQWVEGSSEAIQVAQVVMVLGLGCGYHVVQLARQYPQKKVVVIEANAVLVRQVQELHGLDLAPVEILVAEDVESLAKLSRFKKSLTKIFLLLEHKASLKYRPDFYQEARDLILGRNRVGLQYHLRLRDEMDAVFEWKKLMNISSQILSIKDLNRALKPDLKDGSVAQILSCLQEFVK
jgi:hypothetical protein